jgi:hypothetical protein
MHVLGCSTSRWPLPPNGSNGPHCVGLVDATACVLLHRFLVCCIVARHGCQERGHGVDTLSGQTARRALDRARPDLALKKSQVYWESGMPRNGIVTQSHSTEGDIYVY